MNKEELINEILSSPFWQGGDKGYLRSLKKSELEELYKEGESCGDDLSDYEKEAIMEQKESEDLEEELTSNI